MHNIVKILLSLLLIFIISCDNNEDKSTTLILEGNLTSFTTCKFLKSHNSIDTVSINQSCVVYTYSNEILYLTHVNAGFNCCPGAISSDFIFDNNTITIFEYENEALCNCNCLYDLEMEISGLNIDTYNFIFNEPYWNNINGSLEFSINLNDSLSGSICVTRNTYPWGLY